MLLDIYSVFFFSASFAFFFLSSVRRYYLFRAIFFLLLGLGYSYFIATPTMHQKQDIDNYRNSFAVCNKKMCKDRITNKKISNTSETIMRVMKNYKNAIKEVNNSFSCTLYGNNEKCSTALNSFYPPMCYDLDLTKIPCSSIRTKLFSNKQIKHIANSLSKAKDIVAFMS